MVALGVPAGLTQGRANSGRLTDGWPKDWKDVV